MSEQGLKVEAEILKRIDSIRPSNPKKSDYTHGIDVGLAMAKVAIKDAPTIEERKTGKWIPEFNGAFTGGAYWFRCSECGRIVPEVRNGGWDYCPKCGTSNVQEGEDNERT